MKKKEQKKRQKMEKPKNIKDWKTQKKPQLGQAHAKKRKGGEY
jgi:hypothetical protein